MAKAKASTKSKPEAEEIDEDFLDDETDFPDEFDEGELDPADDELDEPEDEEDGDGDGPPEEGGDRDHPQETAQGDSGAKPDVLPGTDGMRFYALLSQVHDMLDPSVVRFPRDLVQGGMESDAVDDIIRPTIQRLDKFMSQWANGRP